MLERGPSLRRSDRPGTRRRRMAGRDTARRVAADRGLPLRRRSHGCRRREEHRCLDRQGRWPCLPLRHDLSPSSRVAAECPITNAGDVLPLKTISLL